MQVSDGLTEAHSHGVVHRDIKPSNILVNDRGRVTIVDSGLATFLKKDPAPGAGLIQGTASYMSPEQIQGLAIDGRSDLFSTGVVLYELLTGALPFPGATFTDTLQVILEKDPVPMIEHSTAVPLELERVVSRLLARDREKRYQSADSLGADLRYTLEAVVSGRVQYHGRKKEYARSIAVLPFANLSAACWATVFPLAPPVTAISIEASTWQWSSGVTRRPYLSASARSPAAAWSSRATRSPTPPAA